MNNKLLNYLKCLYIMQYMVQCSNIYGSRLGFWHWAKIIFPVFIMKTTPIFNAFDERQMDIKKINQKPSVTETVLFIVATLCLVDGPIAISSIPLQRYFVQLVAALLHAGSLWCFLPNDTLAFSNYMKVPLAESSVVLAVVWSSFLSLLFSVFPLASYAYQNVIYEGLPCLLHIVFCWAIGFCWVLVTIYTHHRMQIVADSRRCGVWELLPKEEGAGGGKVPTWKSGAQYRRGDVVASSSRHYRLESPHSSYNLPPSASASRGALLRLRERLHSVLTRDSGPVGRSIVLGTVLGGMLATCALMAATALVFPGQQQRGFLLMAFAHAVLIRQFKLTFMGGGAGISSGDDCPSFVYHPYGHIVDSGAASASPEVPSAQSSVSSSRAVGSGHSGKTSNSKSKASHR